MEPDLVLCCITSFFKSAALCLLFLIQRRFRISIEHILDSYIKFQQIWSLSGDPEFCEDDFDIENIFRSAFGGSRSFYWSFINEEINEENPRWRRSGGFSDYGNSWRWRRYRWDNGHGSSTDSESESDGLDSNSVSERLALGLSASGPLKLEDVKIAWVLFHPLFTKMLGTLEASASGFYLTWF